MSELIYPQPVKGKFFTPGMIIVTLVALNGIVFLALRFLYGMGAVTNLNNQYPWGIWIGVDVAAGVVLAAGGFVSAAMGHIFHLPYMKPIVRPALLTAMLGYTFVAFAVMVDIGRWYYIWHPLVMWNGTSPLFEVGICVMIYLTVLYVEFTPIISERFRGKVNLPTILSGFNGLVEWILKVLDNTVGKVMFLFLIAGVVLSTLHQSSLGTLMVIAGYKVHPLWQTPILPLLFFISAICVGIPMIIFESLIASRSFKIEPEMHVLSKIAGYVPLLLGIYLAFKLGDMFIRQSFVYMTEINKFTIAFTIEIVFGIILPMVMLMSRRVLNSPFWLFIASALVVVGVGINRINNFIVAYQPPYAKAAYVPSFGEISVTLGCIALTVIIYRAIVMIFPVISLPKQDDINDFKHYRG
jgi:Ni/Fe-hydrogenase subunit HybB-like protein